MTNNTANTRPLCVDLDGTFLRTDTLLELLMCALRTAPWVLLCVPLWILRGKHILKRELAQRFSLNSAVLPTSPAFLAWLQQQHANGRVLVLATGSHDIVAREVAAHYDMFSDVLATTDEGNLTGARKAAALVARFGANQFDYAGNDTVDLAVWPQAHECILVNCPQGLAKRLAHKVIFSQVFDTPQRGLKSWLKAIRLHQWAKNMLVFVPLVAAHRVLEMPLLLNAAIAFLAFGTLASFCYLFNDLADLDADRQHHSKHKRKLASGELPITHALVMAMALLGVSVYLQTLLPVRFSLMMVLYFVITNAYSFRLKAIPILDVALLAGLYTLRIFAGGEAVQVHLSFWLLAFSAFFFFSLAVVKRVSELQHLARANQTEVKNRGYLTSDLQLMMMMGVSSAFVSVLVLALYVDSTMVTALYRNPSYMWLLCPAFLLWLGRVWLITSREKMHDDPVVFALRDRVSWLIFGAAGLILLLASVL